MSIYANDSTSVHMAEYVLDSNLEAVNLDFLHNHILSSNYFEISDFNLSGKSNKGASTSNSAKSTNDNELCVTITSYKEVDKCNGELVTQGERPECFNSDGTRATKKVEVASISACSSTPGGGSIVGTSDGDPGTSTGSTGGGGTNSGGTADGDNEKCSLEDKNGDCVELITSPTGLSARKILVNSIVSKLGLSIFSLETLWLNDIATEEQLSSIDVFLKQNEISPEVPSEEAKTEAKMRIATEATNWDFSKTGIYLNRTSLKYKARADVPSTFGIEKMYLLENGLVLYTSVSPKSINKKVLGTISSTEYNAENYHYIYSYETKKYYEYRLPPANYPDADIDFLLDAFWTGTKIVARYATTLEDAMILIDGKDFDGVEQGKVQTAGFMIVGFIPGGKVLKPISKGTGKVWKVIIKNGDKVFTRTVRELTQETIQHFDNYLEGAKDLLQEALRKGDILDDEIIIEVGQEIAEHSAKKGRKLTWEEVKALFKRGQDFNKKAENIYEFNEVTLKNGKRLDSYIPGQEIISRKATTLVDIKPETFKSYLQEIINKYPKGAEINAPKFGDEFLNKTLSGDYYLEIPLSNKTFFENSTTFQQVLTQFNVDNNVLIRIKYLAE